MLAGLVSAPETVRAWLAWFATLGALSWTHPAAARTLSGYERESVRLALQEVGGTLDPSPGSKIIEGIDVVTLDVIERRDPAPRFLNWFHAKTRDEVVSREMLLRPGQAYDEKLVAESERNLRVRQSSVVIIVPTASATPGRVRLLVVTKDVWSLRLNWDAVGVNGRLQALYLQPAEENLFGRRKVLTGNFSITPSTYSAGLGFIDPRVAGTRIQSSVAASLVWNCQTRDVEGSFGGFNYGKPLYSTRTRWAWATSFEWQEGIVRPAGTLGQSLCNGGPAMPVALPRSQVAVPYQYHRDELYGLLAVTRSFGIALKHNVAFGIESVRHAYRPAGLAGASPAVTSEFSGLLPVNDTRISPFIQLHGYENRFQRTLDVDSLALQEDFRLGLDTWIRAYPASRGLGSTRTLLGVFTGAGYSLPISDGLVQAYVASNIELADARRSDAEVLVGARFVSPRTGAGRFVADGYFLDRYMNYLNPLESLGGTTRLRGYRPLAFVGANVVAGNLEFRTRSVELFAIQLGAVVFYDVGHAAPRFSDLSVRHGGGAGLRMLFPQLDRTVFRLDFGVPLNPSDEKAELTVVVRFQQAFGAPGISPASVRQADPTPETSL